MTTTNNINRQPSLQSLYDTAAQDIENGNTPGRHAGHPTCSGGLCQTKPGFDRAGFRASLRRRGVGKSQLDRHQQRGQPDPPRRRRPIRHARICGRGAWRQARRRWRGRRRQRNGDVYKHRVRRGKQFVHPRAELERASGGHHLAPRGTRRCLSIKLQPKTKAKPRAAPSPTRRIARTKQPSLEDSAAPHRM